MAPSVALATTVDNSNVFDGLVTAQTPILYTPGAGQVPEWHHTANTDTRQGASSYLPAGTAPDAVTMQYAITQNTTWVMTSLEVCGIPGVSGSSDHKVGVTSADTTPKFLQDKIDLISSDLSVTITPSVQNPGADEVLQFDLSATGGGGSSSFTINQTAHGFLEGDIIRPDVNQWTLSQSDDPANAEAWAQVTVIVDVNHFTAVPLVGLRQQQAGIVALIAGFAGGDALYVDAVTPGAVTNVAPTAIGEVTKPVGYVEADAAGVPISFLTVNYRGQENQVTPNGGDSTSNVSAGPAASSTQTITHSLGRLPKIIRLHGMGQFVGGASAANLNQSQGIFDTSGNRCLYISGVPGGGGGSGSSMNPTTSTTFAIRLENGLFGGDSAQGVVQNLTSTTFDIVWTLSGGSLAGGAFIWEAQ